MIILDLGNGLVPDDIKLLPGLKLISRSGGRLNKKDRLTGYGDSHVKDKTSYRPSYL